MLFSFSYETPRSISSGSTGTHGKSNKQTDSRLQSRNSLNETSSDESLDTLSRVKSAKRDSVNEEQLNKSQTGFIDRLVLSPQMDITDDTGLNSKSKTFVMVPTPPLTPRPKSSSPSQSYSRLGSAKHQVVPPIATTDCEK